MSFDLKTVVPWGRNLAEYIKMFSLSDDLLKQRIISFGDGPASFNAEMLALGNKVISLDPVYQYNTEELAQRIQETKEEILAQTASNKDNFNWSSIPDIESLEKIRVQAMSVFLEDFEQGKLEGRYINHALPARTPFTKNEFDLGLSSHFLILYPQLGVNFHLEAIVEMLRVCREVRIFPLLNLNAVKSEVLPAVLEYFESNYNVFIEQVDYEFQKGGNQMLRIIK